MSHPTIIKSVRIKGLRSYSVDKEALIRFSTPLTIILGQNGAGKSTIIEALKWAFAGVVPPNSDKGKKFVHDCSIIGRNKVKATVVLELQRGLQNIKVTRNITVELRRKKLVLSNSKVILRSGSPQSADVSVTLSASEYVDQLAMKTGVSKAVLENVVFCHQEESTWILDKDSDVKKRFDDIFASSRYQEALDFYTAALKETRSKTSSLNRELEISRAFVEEFRVKNEERASLTERFQQTETQYGEVRKKLKAAEKHLEALERVTLEMQGLVSKLERKKNAVIENRTRLGRLTEAVGAMPQVLSQDYTEDQLSTIETIDLVLVQLRGALPRIKEKIMEQKQKTRKFDSSIRPLERELGRLEAVIANAEREIAKSERVIERADQEHASVLEQYSLSDHSAVDQHLVVLSHNVSDAKEAVSTAESRYHSRVAECRGQISSHESNKQRLDTERSEYVIEKSKLTTLATTAASLPQRIASITSSLKTAAQEVSRCKDLLDRHSAPLVSLDNDVKAATALRKELSARQVAVLTLKTENSKILAEHNAHIARGQALSAEAASVDITAPSPDSGVNQPGLGFPDGSIPTLLQIESARHITKTEYQRMDTKIKTVKSELTDLKSRSAAFSALRSSLRSKIRGLAIPSGQIDMSSANARSTSQLALEQLDKEIPVVEKQLETAMFAEQNEAALLELASQLASYAVSTHCCPVCSSKGDPEQIRTGLKRCLLSSRGDADSSVGRSLHTGFLKQKLVILYKSKLNLVESCIKELEASIKTSERFVTKMSSNLNVVKKLYRALKDQYGPAAETLPQLPNIDIDINIDISGELRNAEMSETAALRSRDAAQKSVQQSRVSLDRAKSKHEEILKAQIALEREKAELQVGDVDAKLAQLESSIATVETHIREEDQQLRSLRRQERDLGVLKDDSSYFAAFSSLKAAERALNDFQDVKTRLNEQIRTKTSAKTSIADRSQALIDNRCCLSTSQSEMKQLLQSKSQSEAELVGFEGQLTIMTDCEAWLQTQRRRVDAEELLMISISEVEEAETQLRSKAFDPTAHDSSLKQAKLSVSTLSGEVSTLKERGKSIRDNLNRIGREFKRTKVEVDKHFEREKLHALSKMEVKDLLALSSKLEATITSFHQEKMEEVNEQLKLIWREVYRGKDIDYITITSETGVARGSRRSYSYHLDMVPVGGDQRIPMRGRCSAGQKVLASILVRLALSLSFSANCGVLALDEPTTNLDSANSESLADALKRLIVTRLQKLNFQLILISHDETFIRSLQPSEQLSVHSFWRVLKDTPRGAGGEGKHCSHIVEEDIQTLF
eukprot:gnl/Dysnectes_brevis/1634_a1859_794.p1 GENE.gnl/Dysnectes_brevis/1634_a1859_794~~gnl/Dysnectes_brevis/1634_a1859_794.p1  ORF type:complete len:1310 (-),score=161.82 gnl/Dysnectes_brevis/1634_a1859_794:618-4547(-)